MAPRRTGVLTLRAWLEEDPDNPLRVLMRHTQDVSGGVETVLSFANTSQVLAAVERWLADVLTAEDVETLLPGAGGDAPAVVTVRIPGK